MCVFPLADSALYTYHAMQHAVLSFISHIIGTTYYYIYMNVLSFLLLLSYAVFSFRVGASTNGTDYITVCNEVIIRWERKIERERYIKRLNYRKPLFVKGAPKRIHLAHTQNMQTKRIKKEPTWIHVWKISRTCWIEQKAYALILAWPILHFILPMIASYIRIK